MLISICPYNLEVDEGEAYVETRMREIGIMVNVITSDFIQHIDEDDTEPSHFAHRVKWRIYRHLKSSLRLWRRLNMTAMLI